jgi:Capsular polysaccharide synthesis protein
MSVVPSVVHTFWHGGELPRLALTCLGSFLTRGHRLCVHSYERIAVPHGATWEDASDVVPRDELERRDSTPGAITSFADVFRYELLLRYGGWWVDTDVYCLCDELPEGDHAWAEQEPGLLNNAILKFPPGDPLCARLAALARERARPGLSWGTLGPTLVTEVLSGSDGIDPTRLGPSFYPIHWLEAHALWLPEWNDEVQRRLRRASFLHCWAQALSNMGIDLDSAPPRGSYLATMLDTAIDGDESPFWNRLRTRRSIGRYLRQPWVRDYWESRVGREWSALTRAPKRGAEPTVT